jgi:alpha-N-arabinofuranosidase
LLAGASPTTTSAEDVTLKVSARPLNEHATINPMIFGNFIELLDDLVPGMWAEMLNDRGFEGVTKPANWVYYDGSLTVCDREWEKNDDWSVETSGAFNGPNCARIVVRPGRDAVLSQGGLAVKDGVSYQLTGYLRGVGQNLKVKAVLKAHNPSGGFVDLDSSEFSEPNADWVLSLAPLSPMGTSDRAVLEQRVTGEGTVWVDKLSLMSMDTRQGWRPDVVDAIRASRPALIRWGGSAVDPGRYRWKDGIGDRDRRVPFPNVNWGRIDPNDVGIDEFCRFCKLVGAEPLICISFSDGPESAGDLVEYCNGSRESSWGSERAKNGSADPYRVKYWQLGNELSGDDDAYIKKCKAFVQAMKSRDQGISLLSSFPSQKVLDELGKDLAFVAPHHYTRNLGYCETEFLKLGRMIANTRGSEHLRLAVTEWNSTAGDWGLLRARMLTLEGALHNARYLNLMCRHSDIVTMACRSNMTNSYCSGIIETRPFGVLLRPSYHVMKLYAEHARGKPVASGRMPDGLDVMASMRGERESLCVLVVNSRNEPVTLALDLSEFGEKFAPLSARTVRDTLDMRQPDVMNHWDSRERVRTVDLPLSGRKITLPAFSVTAVECGQPSSRGVGDERGNVPSPPARKTAGR